MYPPFYLWKKGKYYYSITYCIYLYFLSICWYLDFNMFFMIYLLRDFYLNSIVINEILGGNTMSRFTGTKTEKNLMEAFAGE